jgi:hypothetical protein
MVMEAAAFPPQAAEARRAAIHRLTRP